MLAQIRNHRGKIAAFILVAAASTMVSCATHKEDVRLVKDPDEKPETLMPWNKQEKWETGGQLANMTDRR
jgi:hypothetical protein